MTDDFKLPEDTRYREISEMLLKRLGPVTKAFEFTPSDTTDETRICRAVQANTTGAVKVMFADQTTWVNTYVLQGVTYPWRLRRISIDSVATMIGLE